MPLASSPLARRGAGIASPSSQPPQRLAPRDPAPRPVHASCGTCSPARGGPRWPPRKAPPADGSGTLVQPGLGLGQLCHGRPATRVRLSTCRRGLLRMYVCVCAVLSCGCQSPFQTPSGFHQQELVLPHPAAPSPHSSRQQRGDVPLSASPPERPRGAASCLGQLPVAQGDRGLGLDLPNLSLLSVALQSPSAFFLSEDPCHWM